MCAYANGIIVLVLVHILQVRVAHATPVLTPKPNSGISTDTQCWYWYQRIRILSTTEENKL